MPAIPHISLPLRSATAGLDEGYPGRPRGAAGAQGSSHEDRAAEQLDDEDPAEDPEAEAQVRVHGETVAVVDHPEDAPAVEPLHEVLQVEAVELEPDAGEAPLRTD